MDAGLKNRGVLITGASSGIGAAAAEAFAAEGARLALHAHTGRERAEALADRLATDTTVVAADVADARQLDAAFAHAIARLGGIDIVVANAGIWPSEPKPIHEMQPAQWRRTLEVNLTGVFHTARAFFKHLADCRPAAPALVLVGSTAAVFGEEGHADYAASKAAVTYGLTLSLKNEIVRLCPDGRVNAVCPGWTRTPMAEEGLADHEAVRDVLQTRALARVADAGDVAAAIVYLASPTLAGHVTGQVITVAGGMEGRLLHRREDVDPGRA
jgi:3-oxoacyl-[acyl-carrier protein] reductase